MTGCQVSFIEDKQLPGGAIVGVYLCRVHAYQYYGVRDGQDARQPCPKATSTAAEASPIIALLPDGGVTRGRQYSSLAEALAELEASNGALYWRAGDTLSYAASPEHVAPRALGYAVLPAGLAHRLLVIQG